MNQRVTGCGAPSDAWLTRSIGQLDCALISSKAGNEESAKLQGEAMVQVRLIAEYMHQIEMALIKLDHIEGEMAGGGA